MTMLSGCGNTDLTRIDTAAKAQGVTQARVSLPDLPERCRDPMGRVVPKVGEKARWSQKRWEYSADNIDRQITDCAAFYDTTKTNFEKGR